MLASNKSRYILARRPQFIGKSSNAPCPNLKKLIMPASTTATTTIFFPAFSTANGLTLRCCDEAVTTCARPRRCRNTSSRSKTSRMRAQSVKLDPEIGCVLGAGTVVAGLGLPDWTYGVRRRGTGGGKYGSSSSKADNSDREGAGVVRALVLQMVRLLWIVDTERVHLLDDNDGKIRLWRSRLLERGAWLIKVVEYLVRRVVCRLS